MRREPRRDTLRDMWPTIVAINLGRLTLECKLGLIKQFVCKRGKTAVNRVTGWSDI